ncbi:MAG: site-specific DNA-methyltransferase, partial [Chloroflexota bacterium]|nr:site-specific DNA-methyltransferase [Chloroflexota bacterium]
TTKPVELLRRFISNSSRRDQIVLDPFLGSGSTLIAAELLQRRCFGIEIDPAYCDVALARYEAVTGRRALRSLATI